MQRVDEPMETIHVYVIRDEEPRSSSLLPLFFACLCLVALVALTVYSGEHPALEQDTLHVPALLLPIKTFTASVPVIPTRIKTFPATHATGTLTITNGSIVSVELPTGILFTTPAGMEVVTETTVWVPAGSAAGYGRATVAAQVVPSGIDLPPLALNQVVGTALYVQNLSAFTGGRKASRVSVRTPEDRLRAIAQARAALAPAMLSGLLFAPCHEYITGDITLTWHCQFVTYRISSFMRVISVRMQGGQVLVEVVYVVRPSQLFRGK